MLSCHPPYLISPHLLPSKDHFVGTAFSASLDDEDARDWLKETRRGVSPGKRRDTFEVTVISPSVSPHCRPNFFPAFQMSVYVFGVAEEVLCARSPCQQPPQQRRPESPFSWCSEAARAFLKGVGPLLSFPSFSFSLSGGRISKEMPLQRRGPTQRPLPSIPRPTAPPGPHARELECRPSVANRFSPSARSVGKHACLATAIQAILIIAVHKACIPMMRADGKVQAFAILQGFVWHQTLPKMKMICRFCEL